MWQALGWLLLTIVIVASLVQIEQPLEVTGIDKFEHVLAYGVLMYWWGMVQPRRILAWALLLPLLGLSLELVQQRLPGRFMEWRDVFANLAGVVLGCLLLMTGARRLLGWIDRHLFERLDAGPP
jgi:VanZ family protein